MGRQHDNNPVRPKIASPFRNRDSIRLKEYGYTREDADFVTACIHGRPCLFGKMAGGKMVLNDAGRMVADEWTTTGLIADEIQLDEWVVMPDHFHGIVYFQTL